MQAQETLDDAEKIFAAGGSARSVVNRAYYAAFYAVLALFLKNDINLKSSKHAGILSLFDREFIHSGKIDRAYSKIIHRLFDERQAVDYKEFSEVTPENARALLDKAREFFDVIVPML
jgi:uncharacterized protein (UPF0332 family)